jgi:hypothetical protein
MKIVIAFLLNFLLSFTLTAQVLSVGDEPLPCKCDVKIQFYDYRTLSTKNRYSDSIFRRIEKKAKDRFGDGIPCVYYFAFNDLGLKVILHNFSDTDVLPEGVYVDGLGYLSVHFDKIRNGKRIPMKVLYPSEQRVVDVIVKRGQIDTTIAPFISVQSDPDADYTKDSMRVSALDTGLYVVKGSYMQKCNGKVNKKYTNEVFFRLVE